MADASDLVLLNTSLDLILNRFIERGKRTYLSKVSAYFKYNYGYCVPSSMCKKNSID